MSFSDVMLAFTALFTGGLVLVAWIAYKKLIFQEASKKQLEVVIGLIQALQIKEVNFGKVMRSPDNNVDVVMSPNIFGFKTFATKVSDLPLLIEIVDNQINMQFIFQKEFYHPLLPTKITEAWDNVTGKLKIKSYNQTFPLPDVFYWMGKTHVDFTLPVRLDTFMYTDGARAFIEDCIGVHQSILGWLKEKGVKDINYRALQAHAK